MNFTPKDPDESIFYGIDFAALLGEGETITGATASNRVISGTDSTPAAMLSGSPVIAANIVTHLIIGGVAGCAYKLGFVITTSSGQTFVEAGVISVKERQ